jgi:hypothetical protein
MDPETQKRFEEFDARMGQAERRILATGNLVGRTGIPWLVDTQVKVDALMDSQTRLYGVLQQLTEKSADTQVKVDTLMDSQTRLYGALQQLAEQTVESQKKTDENLSRLAATVQAFIDSMRQGGNGSKS